MFKVLTEGCEPTRGTKFSAAVDLYASETVVIGAGETKIVGLGVCIDLDSFMKEHYLKNGFDEDYKTFELDFLKSHFLQLMLRSSLGKKGLIIPNGVGVIDLDYTQELKLLIHNPLTWKTATNIAISWCNNALRIMSCTCSIGFLTIEKDGFDSNGAFIISKEDKAKNIKASKIGQITLLEHKSFLFSIESDIVRDGGFGSSGE